MVEAAMARHLLRREPPTTLLHRDMPPTPTTRKPAIPRNSSNSLPTLVLTEEMLLVMVNLSLMDTVRHLPVDPEAILRRGGMDRRPLQLGATKGG